ncbi:MAG: hypothetical protein ACRECH_18335, partial [Nitrososphaerales archaeon]
QHALVADYEKQVRKSLEKRLKATQLKGLEDHPSRNKEFEKLLRKLIPVFKQEFHPMGRTTIRNVDFRNWVKTRPEYHEFKHKFFGLKVNG